MSQNKKSSVSLGPGAASLILIFVVLTLGVLAMLGLMNGRNDVQLSLRSAQVAEAMYTLNCQAEGTRADLDALLLELIAQVDSDETYLAALEAELPENMTLEERDIVWTETDGIRVLHCAVRVLPLGESPREEWVKHSMVSVAAEEEGEEEMFDW